MFYVCPLKIAYACETKTDGQRKRRTKTTSSPSVLCRRLRRSSSSSLPHCPFSPSFATFDKRNALNKKRINVLRAKREKGETSVIPGVYLFLDGEQVTEMLWLMLKIDQTLDGFRASITRRRHFTHFSREHHLFLLILIFFFFLFSLLLLLLLLLMMMMMMMMMSAPRMSAATHRLLPSGVKK